MIYLDLLVTFMLIGVMTFGGGYSILPLVEELAINQHQWLTTSELADIISISEMSPGPFSLNCSTFVGMKVAGFPGAAVATFSFLLLPFLIVLVLAYFYNKYRGLSYVKTVFSVLNSCIIAVLLHIAIKLFSSSVPGLSLSAGKPDLLAWGIFAASFLAMFRWKVNPLFIIFAAAVLGMILYPVII